MKSLYIICHNLWSNKARISILALQIFLACLVFNMLLCRFMYLDQVRQIIWSSNLEQAVLFSPEVRFGNLILEKIRGVNPEADPSRDAVYNKMKEEITGYPGITALGTIRHGVWRPDVSSLIIDKESGEKLPVSYDIYDEVMLKNFNLPLAQGKLSHLLQKEDKIPAFVSAPLAKKYGGMGAEISFTIMQQGKEYPVNTVVAGILAQDYFTYILPGGGSSNGLSVLNELISRKISEETDFFFILPPLVLSDGAQPVTVEDIGFICFTDKSVNLNDALTKWNKQAHNDGLGSFTSFPDLNKNQIEFTLDNNRKMAALGFMIFMVSGVGIGGFNVLRLIKEKRNTAINFMVGMDWTTYMRIEVLKNFVIVAVPASLSLAITKILFADNDNNLNKMLFGPANIMGTLLIILFFVITTVIIFRFMTRDRNIVSLMRKDEE